MANVSYNAVTGYSSPVNLNAETASGPMNYFDWKFRGPGVGKTYADYQNYLAQQSANNPIGSNASNPLQSNIANQTNQALGAQREGTLANFVNTMTQPAAATDGYNQDAAHAGNALSSYVNTSPDSMPNRFEGALGDTQNRMASLLDNPDSIKNSAAYKFDFNQGMDAVNRQLAARGLLGSGNRLMALTDYGQGKASQEYGNQFARLSGLYGTNTQGYLGNQTNNTSAWNAQGNQLNNYYQNATGNANANFNTLANQRLGWGQLWNAQAAKPQQFSVGSPAWSIAG